MYKRFLQVVIKGQSFVLFTSLLTNKKHLTFAMEFSFSEDLEEVMKNEKYPRARLLPRKNSTVI